MNPWFKDSRVEQAEELAFDAERAERRGDPSSARSRYREAAEKFAAVALTVHADYPIARSDLAIAGVACFARAGDFGRATEFARRVLAESSALTQPGKNELARLLGEYDALVAHAPLHKSSSDRGRALREEVRRRFTRAA